MIVLVRHGEALDAAGRAIGRTDLPLSPRGREQAAELASALGRIPWTRLFTSPLLRAQDTLAPLAAAAGLAPTLLDGLAEISLGDWDGLPWAEIRERYPADYAARGRGLAKYRPPGGESFAELAARAGATLDELTAGPLPVLAVTHAGVLRVLLARVQDLDLRDVFRFSPAPGRCTLFAPRASGLAVAGADLSPAEASARFGPA